MDIQRQNLDIFGKFQTECSTLVCNFFKLSGNILLSSAHALRSTTLKSLLGKINFNQSHFKDLNMLLHQHEIYGSLRRRGSWNTVLGGCKYKGFLP